MVETSTLVVTNSINIAGRFIVDSSGNFQLKDGSNVILDWNKSTHGKAEYLKLNGDLDMVGHELGVTTINSTGWSSVPWYIAQGLNPNNYELHGLSLVDVGSVNANSITLGGVTKTSWPSAATAVFG